MDKEIAHQAVRLMINDYCKKYKKENYFSLREYLNTIRFTIEDYEDENISMSIERNIYSGLEIVLEKRNKKNKDESPLEDGFNTF